MVIRGCVLGALLTVLGLCLTACENQTNDANTGGQGMDSGQPLTGQAVPISADATNEELGENGSTTIVIEFEPDQADATRMVVSYVASKAHNSTSTMMHESDVLAQGYEKHFTLSPGSAADEFTLTPNADLASGTYRVTVSIRTTNGEHGKATGEQKGANTEFRIKIP